MFNYSEDGDSAWVESRDLPEDVDIPEDFEEDDGDDGEVETREVEEENDVELEADE